NRPNSACLVLGRIYSDSRRSQLWRKQSGGFKFRARASLVSPREWSEDQRGLSGLRADANGRAGAWSKAVLNVGGAGSGTDRQRSRSRQVGYRLSERIRALDPHRCPPARACPAFHWASLSL